MHVLGPGNFGDVEISGIAFGNFSRAQGDGVAVWVQDARTATIGSNHIGLSADGSLVSANDVGVKVDSARDTNIDGNVISGNRVGVLSGARRQPLRSGLAIDENRIGTNRAGTAVIADTEDGIRIVSGCAAPACQFRIYGNLISGDRRNTGLQLADEHLSRGDHQQPHRAGCDRIRADRQRPSRRRRWSAHHDKHAPDRQRGRQLDGAESQHDWLQRRSRRGRVRWRRRGSDMREHLSVQRRPGDRSRCRWIFQQRRRRCRHRPESAHEFSRVTVRSSVRRH